MSLTYTFAPECIVFSIRKDRVGIQTVQGEHSRIPANRDDPDFAAFFCSCVYIRIVLRNPCVGVKAVDHIEKFCILRRLLRKIGCASAAEDHDIDLVFPLSRVCNTAYRNAFCLYLYSRRVTACEDCGKLHIRILLYRALHASPEISIA